MADVGDGQIAPQGKRQVETQTRHAAADGEQQEGGANQRRQRRSHAAGSARSGCLFCRMLAVSCADLVVGLPGIKN